MKQCAIYIFLYHLLLILVTKVCCCGPEGVSISLGPFTLHKIPDSHVHVLSMNSIHPLPFPFLFFPSPPFNLQSLFLPPFLCPFLFFPPLSSPFTGYTQNMRLASWLIIWGYHTYYIWIRIKEIENYIGGIQYHGQSVYQPMSRPYIVHSSYTWSHIVVEQPYK